MTVEIKYKLVGLRKLQNATHLAPGILYNREIEAMHRSVNLVEGLLVGATNRGPGHFGDHMIDRWSTRVATGPRRIVGVASNSTVQSRWFDQGTKPHEIHAKAGGVLKMGELGWSTVVKHPGVKGRHIVKKALTASRSAIRVFFLDAANGVVQSMATSGD